MKLTLHRHKLEAVAVQRVSGGTLILFRCERMRGPGCAETRSIPGNWSMDDLDILPRNWPQEITGDGIPEGIAREGVTNATG